MVLKTKIHNHSRILLFLFIFSILYSILFIKVYEYPISSDEEYYAYGVNLYKGNGYSYNESSPFRKSNLREPGYPFFLYGLFKIFGVSKSVVQIIQAILNGIIVLVTYKLAGIIFDDKNKALIAAFLTAISPTIAGYAGFILSETLAAVYLMLAFLSFLALLKEKKGDRIIVFSVLTGFLCGCLALTKMAYLLFFPLACLTLLIALPNKFIKYKAVLCAVIVFIGILFPWFSFNNKVYGNPFFLTNRSGLLLTVKEERMNSTPKAILVSFLYPISERAVERYFPNEYRRLIYNQVEGSAYKAAFDKYKSLISRGYSEIAADSKMRQEALSKIKGNILRYVIHSISDFHFMLYFEGLPLSQYSYFFKREIRSSINFFFKIYSLVIIFFAVKGIFIMIKNKENLHLKIAFLTPIIYTFLIYSAIVGAPRLTFLAIPFIYALASAGILEGFKSKAAL